MILKALENAPCFLGGFGSRTPEVRAPPAVRF